jgi:hypothetical protein
MVQIIFLSLVQRELYLGVANRENKTTKIPAPAGNFQDKVTFVKIV